MYRKFLFTLIVISILAALGMQTAAHAATLTVNTLTDENDGSCSDGDCSLRDAIAVTAIGDTINFGVTGAITLTLGQLAIDKDLIINGPGAGSMTISGDNASRVFSINSGVNVVLSGVTIANGNGEDGGNNYAPHSAGDGGGIHNEGALTLDNCTITGNSTSQNGGGIYNASGELTIMNSVISDNTALGGSGGGIFNGDGLLDVTNSAFSGNITNSGHGGAIANGGRLTITNTTLSNNNASASGGGILSSGTLSVSHSAFSGNSADWGGGIATCPDSYGPECQPPAISAKPSDDNIIAEFNIEVTNSSFSNNSASNGAGGGIYIDGSALSVINSAFSGNSASTRDNANSKDATGMADGGAIYNLDGSGDTVVLRNTIVANSIANGNCGGTITNSGNNLDDGTTCGWGSDNGSMSGTNPLLGALTGSPGYFPLNTGSPAIDAGDNAACADEPVNNTSQNGLARPIDGDGDGTAICDIGSYEAPTGGDVIIPGSDWHIEYDGWVGAGDANASGGSYRLSNVKKNKAIFKFSGDTIKWITRKGPDQGIAQVFIDKKLKGTFDLYRSTVKHNVKKTFKGLGSGKHRLVIRVSGDKNAKASDSLVFLDAFVVGNVRTEESSPKVIYNYWKGVVNANASSGTLRMSKKKRSKAILTFTGTSVNWITATGPKYGNANVMIDGVDKGNFDLYSATPQYQVARTFDGLSAGQHTIQIRPLRTKNPASGGYWVVVDAFSGPITLASAHAP